MCECDKMPLFLQLNINKFDVKSVSLYKHLCRFERPTKMLVNRSRLVNYSANIAIFRSKRI